MTVARLHQLYKDTGDVSHRKGGGRPPKMTVRSKRKFIREFSKTQNLSLKAATASNIINPKNYDRKTIRNVIRKAGLRPYTKKLRKILSK